jgi:hypothetical protein
MLVVVVVVVVPTRAQLENDGTVKIQEIDLCRGSDPRPRTDI